MHPEYIIDGVEKMVEVSKETLGEQIFSKLKQCEKLPVAIVDTSSNNVSYKNIFDNSVQLAINLRRRGFSNQDVLGICSKNTTEFVYPLLAGLYLGIPITTFSPSYTFRELLHAANISKPTIMFCNKENLETVFKVKKQLKSLRKIVVMDIDHQDKQDFECLKKFNSNCSEVEINTFQPNFFNIDTRAAFIIYSSGTTGLPKGVVLTHKNYNVTMSILKDPRFLEQGMPGEGASLGLLPLYHAFGLLILILSIIRGKKFVMLEKFDPFIFLQSIQDYKITELNLVPTLVQFLATTGLIKNYDLSSIEVVVCASAPLSPDMEKLLKQRLNIKSVRQAYGMTETTMIATVPILGDPEKFGSCGVVVPSLKAKVVDIETGKSLGPMQSGELWFKGDSIMSGYAGDKKATDETIDKDGWLHTGDVGYYDEEKRFFIVDRVKELIKYKSFQVPPAEIEAVLISHQDIQDAGVIGIPDSYAGELPMAFIVKKPNANLTEKDVTLFVSNQLSEQKWLRGGVIFVSQIPRNPTGKILRKELRILLNHNKKSKL